MRLRLLLLVITLCYAGPTLLAQSSDTLIPSLIRDVPVWMERNHVPCAGIGLIEAGKIKWLKVFGVLRQGHPAPDNTLFNIASQTKPVTAMLTIKLVQAGLWNLDEPLSRYWVDPDLAGDPHLVKLTTRLVLSHQTGFPNWRTDNGGMKLQFIAEPGTKFGYSGEGFEYLRRALENKFHQSLSALLAKWLTVPQRLGDMRYWGLDMDSTRFAMWHDGQGRPYTISMHTPISAADDLIASVGDYCRFGIYTMSGLGVSDTLFRDMVRPQIKVKDNYYRCLGWGLVTGLPNGEYALEHGGSDVGVRTMAIFLPKSHSGVVVMTNGDNGMFVSDLVIKRALSAGEQVLATMNKSGSAHVRITLPDEVIQSYTGSYVQANGKIMKVEKEGNAIKVSGDGVPTATLYPESNSRFFLEGYDVQIEFPGDGELAIYENGKQVMKIKKQAAF
ncbi:MAG: beta-lactamase family protein [Bacteroidetes bacterium]|nr:beta-lactamase family protein [Bacteroidota bacterium]